MLECEAGACLIIALMIDGDDTNNTWLNKKLDTAKVEGGDVCQPCLGVIGWGYKDIQADDENKLRII